MRTRLAAWVGIQRQRLAHAIYPDAFARDWTPGTVDEAIQDADRWRRHEALNAEREALNVAAHDRFEANLAASRAVADEALRHLAAGLGVDRDPAEPPDLRP